MLFYTFVFVVSTCFFFIASKKKAAITIYSLLGILIPSIIAGLRDLSVGTDTELYYPIYTTIATANSIVEVGDSINTEWFYIVISFIADYFGGYPFLLFICQLLTITLVYLTAYRLRKYVCVWLVMFLYFCFFYNFSLNIMRQCVAVAYVLSISRFLWKKEYKKYLIYSLLSIIFHTSAIIGCIFIFIIYRISLIQKSNNKYIIITLYLCGMTFMYLLFRELGYIFDLMSIGRFSEYTNYLSGDGFVSATDLLYRFFFLLLLLIARKYTMLPENIRFIYLLILITEFFLLMLGLYSHYVYRIALYLTISHLFFLSLISQSNKFTQASRIIFTCCIASIGYLYWIWLIAYRDSSATIPYKLISYQ